MADSRPEPGPLTKTSTLLSPKSFARRAASEEATWAANGVDFLDPLNPTTPGVDQTITFPCMSVIVIAVLLNDALIWAIPDVTPLSVFFFDLSFRFVGLAI